MRAAALVLLFSLALSCVACKAIVPASQQDMEDMQKIQEGFTSMSIRNAAAGNEEAAALYAGLAGLAGVFTTIGLSRKRRAEAALQMTTGSRKIPSLQPPVEMQNAPTA